MSAPDREIVVTVHIGLMLAALSVGLVLGYLLGHYV